MTALSGMIVLAVCWYLPMINADATCQEVKGHTAKFHPKLPVEFVVDVEIVISDTVTVQNMKLYYSTVNKIIRMDITEGSVTSRVYFYYQDGEILVFNYFTGRGQCRVINNLAEAADDFLFGGLRISDGTAEIPMPLSAVHFIGMSGFQDHEIVQRFDGTKNVRGKKANVFTSCQNWTTKGDSIVLNVTHYFADKQYKFPGMGDRSTLLSVEVHGMKTTKDKKQAPVRHRYNYYNMQEGIDNTRKLLETPDGIVCAGRKIDKPFPKFPDQVKLHAESVDNIRQVLVNSEETYNYKENFSIVRSVPSVGDESYITVLDFATDEMYILNQAEGVCKKYAIQDVPANTEIPLYSVLGGKAIMSNPKRFFYADDSETSYLGKKLIRGLLTDTWVGHTRDLSNFPNAIVQWHFDSSLKNGSDANSQASLPIKYKFWPDPSYDKAITQNIFHADYTRHWLEGYDVSSCYKNTKHFRLALDGTRESITDMGVELFKQEATLDIARTAGVRPIRVNQLELFYNEEEVFLEFAISDNTDLQNVTNRVYQAVDTGTLIINILDTETNRGKNVSVHNVTSLPVVHNNYVGRIRPSPGNTDEGGSNGYSLGSMIGLGFGTAVVGLLGGGGAAWLHGKYMY